jgi:DNA topoisomerase IA
MSGELSFGQFCILASCVAVNFVCNIEQNSDFYFPCSFRVMQSGNECYMYQSYHSTFSILFLQCEKLQEQIAQVRDVVSKKDDTSPEEIRNLTSSLQQASLKLFEMAYKKVMELLHTLKYKNLKII